MKTKVVKKLNSANSMRAMDYMTAHPETVRRVAAEAVLNLVKQMQKEIDTLAKRNAMLIEMCEAQLTILGRESKRKAPRKRTK